MLKAHCRPCHSSLNSLLKNSRSSSAGNSSSVCIASVGPCRCAIVTGIAHANCFQLAAVALTAALYQLFKVLARSPISYSTHKQLCSSSSSTSSSSSAVTADRLQTAVCSCNSSAALYWIVGIKLVLPLQPLPWGPSAKHCFCTARMQCAH
jgi:hypothetical protein